MVAMVGIYGLLEWEVMEELLFVVSAASGVPEGGLVIPPPPGGLLDTGAALGVQAVNLHHPFSLPLPSTAITPIPIGGGSRRRCPRSGADRGGTP